MVAARDKEEKQAPFHILPTGGQWWAIVAGIAAEQLLQRLVANTAEQSDARATVRCKGEIILTFTQYVWEWDARAGAFRGVACI